VGEFIAMICGFDEFFSRNFHALPPPIPGILITVIGTSIKPTASRTRASDLAGLS
jgi:xanthine/uracil permease